MSESKEIVKKYTNGELTVVWKPNLCIHSEICFNGMPEVFNPEQKPWVNVHAKKTEDIANHIKKCPSGALSYFMNAEGEKTSGEVEKQTIFTDRTQPAPLDLEASKNYAWCSCGLSESQPFCDGSHSSTDKKPLVFKVEEAGTKYLCMCKKLRTRHIATGHTVNRLFMP